MITNNLHVIFSFLVDNFIIYKVKKYIKMIIFSRCTYFSIFTKQYKIIPCLKSRVQKL